MIKIEQTDITKLKTDAIVNAANTGLYSGSGVCGAIYLAAGPKELTQACREIGHCDTGKAVITDGFNLCKYIIHAVGPIYIDGKHNEEELLYSCYQEALNLAKEHNCKSIGFPLISSGVYSYPVDSAFEVAIRSVNDWLNNNEDMEVIFAVLDEDVKEIGLRFIESICSK